MLSLIPGKTLLQNVIEFVAGKSGEPESSQSLPSPHSRAHTEPPTAAHARPRLKPSSSASMNSNAQVKQRIHDRIFEGTYESGIEVSDDDEDDEVELVSPPKSHKVTTSTNRIQTNRVPKELEQHDRLDRRTNRRGTPGVKVLETRLSTRGTPPSQEEERLLGHISRGRVQDPEAVSIPIPRRSNAMPFHASRTPFNGGFRPVDTLHSAGTSSKQNYYLLSTRKSGTQLGRRQTSGSKTHTSQLQVAQPKSSTEPNQAPSSPPKKRRRIDSSDGIVRSQSSSAGRSPTRNGAAAATTGIESRRILSEMYDLQGAEIERTQPAQVKVTALRKLSLPLPEPSSDRSHQGQRSPDKLFHPNERAGDDDDDAGMQFIREASRDRRSRQIDSEDEHVDSSISRYPKSSNKSDQAAQVVRNHDHSFSTTHSKPSLRTPRTSRIASRLLEESPDVLHKDIDPLDKHPKQRRDSHRTSNSGSWKMVHFSLKRFVCEGVLDARAVNVEVNREKKTFSIHYRSPTIMDDAVSSAIPVSKMLRISLANDDTTNIIMIKLSDGVPLLGNFCFLDFGDSEKSRADFLQLVQTLDSTITIIYRSSAWIQSAMERAPIDKTNRSQRHDTRAADTSKQKLAEHNAALNTSGPRRQRKIDNLDSGPIKVDANGQAGEVAKERDPAPQETSASRNSQTSATRYAERTRETRSKTTKREPDDSSDVTVVSKAAPRRDGPEWKAPLIYPKIGKSRATVTWDDLERLNDDEFLNDNLVALFMRYLQENMDQEQAKRIHFFSTFFYDSLTRPAEKGNRRQINYAAVANWTKNVNLFHRDYVVVPVNESAHWYVMIICNLRYLRDPQVEEEEDVVEVIDRSQVKDSNPDEVPKTILESDILMVKDPEEDDNEIEEITENDAVSTKRRPGRRKSQGLQRRRKYSTRQPIIITLDSLDQGRSGTATALKNYLVEEAKDKFSLDINKELILGMTAKSIPLQHNFSDCGLYLCMYLEQFVRDPDTFVRSILQREETAFSWPKKLRSGDLRQRLYDVVKRLHNAQEGKDNTKLPEIGRLLIKDEDFQSSRKAVVSTEMYEPAKVEAACDYYEKEYTKEAKQQSLPDRMLLDDTSALEVEHSSIPVGHQIESSVIRSPLKRKTEPIVIEDNSQDIIQAKDSNELVSPYFARGPSEKQTMSINKRLDTPLELAEKMRISRPSTENRTGTTGTIERISPEGQEVTDQMDRQLRGVSISTDYMTSDASFRQHHNTSDHLQDQQHIEGSKKEETQQEEEFNGFDDDPVDTTYQRGRQVRDTSVVPDSVQGSEGIHSQDGEAMLLDD